MLRNIEQTFGKNWDAISIVGLKNAPSKKPVLSHYPPGHTMDLNAMADKPGSRLCGPIFAPSDLESQIVRLEGNGMYDHVKLDTPRFAPFTAAGYFVAHSSFLKEVPARIVHRAASRPRLGPQFRPYTQVQNRAEEFHNSQTTPLPAPFANHVGHRRMQTSRGQHHVP